MNEYDLPMKDICPVCHGACGIQFNYKVHTLHKNAYTKYCDNCDRSGFIILALSM